jgi:hypothetical protein
MRTLPRLDSKELCQLWMLEQILDDVGVAGPEDGMNQEERQLCKQAMMDTLEAFEGETVGSIHEAICWWTAGFNAAKKQYKIN